MTTINGMDHIIDGITDIEDNMWQKESAMKICQCLKSGFQTGKKSA
jgi:hypothetical protein